MNTRLASPLGHYFRFADDTPRVFLARAWSQCALGSIEENPSEKRTSDRYGLLSSSVFLLSCPEHAPNSFCKIGKNLGQNAVGSPVAVFAGRLFHRVRRRILTRLG